MVSIFCCLTVICLGLIAFSYVEAEKACSLLHFSMCAADECCHQVVNKPTHFNLIGLVSRKRLMPEPSLEGTCKKYIQERQYCNPKPGSDCGCASGLICLSQRGLFVCVPCTGCSSKGVWPSG